MTKLTLSKPLSLQNQAKLDQLTKSSFVSESDKNVRFQHAQQKSAFEHKLYSNDKRKNLSYKQTVSKSPEQLKNSLDKKDQPNQNTEERQERIDPQEHERMQRRLSHQAFMAASNYLYNTYPNTFSRDDPKPLKLHIEKDIYLNLPEGISRVKIRQALGAYTRRVNYLKAFTKYTQRIDLASDFVEEVTDKQIQHASKMLALKHLEHKRQTKQSRIEKKNKRQFVYKL